jgi:hypothetical protein
MHNIIQRSIILFVALSVFVCPNAARILPQGDRPQFIPQGDYDIVFQTEGGEYDAIGFYSTNTKKSQVFENDYPNPLITPFYFSINGLFVAIESRGFVHDASVDIPGFLRSFTTYPPYRNCKGGFSEEIHPYGNKVASLVEGVIQIYDPELCKFVKVIFSQEEINWNKERFQIRNFSIDENNPNLILSVSQGNKISLFRINLETKEILDFKKFGINPAISPDGKKIAYYATTGIRIMDIDGGNDYSISNGTLWENSNLDNWSKPLWSQNGDKLIYHKCDYQKNNNCSHYSDYSIYIYDFLSRKEQKIIDFGTNPSWVIQS